MIVRRIFFSQKVANTIQHIGRYVCFFIGYFVILFKVLFKAIEYTFAERFKNFMGALGKGSNAFTIECLKGIYFYMIHYYIMLGLQFIIIFKALKK